MSFEKTHLYEALVNHHMLGDIRDLSYLAKQTATERVVTLKAEVDKYLRGDVVSDDITLTYVILVIMAMMDTSETRTVFLKASFDFAESIVLRLALPTASARPETWSYLVDRLADGWAELPDEDESDACLIKMIRLAANRHQAQDIADVIRHREVGQLRQERQHAQMASINKAAKLAGRKMSLLEKTADRVTTAMRHSIVASLNMEETERLFALLPVIRRQPRCVFDDVMATAYQHTGLLGVEQDLQRQLDGLAIEAPFKRFPIKVCIKLNGKHQTYVFSLEAGQEGGGITDFDVMQLAKVIFDAIVPPKQNAVLHFWGKDGHFRAVTNN